MSQWFLLGAGLILFLMGVRIFSPFLTALLAAASVALLLAPAYKSLAARSPKHPTAAAAALTGLVSLLMAVPFFLGGWAVLREAEEAYPAARGWLSGLSQSGSPAWTPPPRWAGVIGAGRDYASALKIDPRAMVLENLDQVDPLLPAPGDLPQEADLPAGGRSGTVPPHRDPAWRASGLGVGGGGVPAALLKHHRAAASPPDTLRRRARTPSPLETLDHPCGQAGCPLSGPPGRRSPASCGDLGRLGHGPQGRERGSPDLGGLHAQGL